jgi:hypothetical protein
MGFVNSELGYWTLALAALSVILGHPSGNSAAPLKDPPRSLLTLTLMSGLRLAVISILVIAKPRFFVFPQCATKSGCRGRRSMLKADVKESPPHVMTIPPAERSPLQLPTVRWGCLRKSIKSAIRNFRSSHSSRLAVNPKFALAC